jgi:hypothetical protein
MSAGTNALLELQAASSVLVNHPVSLTVLNAFSRPVASFCDVSKVCSNDTVIQFWSSWSLCHIRNFPGERSLRQTHSRYASLFLNHELFIQQSQPLNRFLFGVAPSFYNKFSNKSQSIFHTVSGILWIGVILWLHTMIMDEIQEVLLQVGSIFARRHSHSQ